MLAPSTGYIADDVLPAVHDKYNDDMYFENTAKTLSDDNISFVDLRKSFKDAYANGTQLYYKTDHHWTTVGAYTAYEQLCRQLGISPATKDKFSIEQYSGFYGTTYSTSCFWLTLPDTIEVWNNRANTSENIGVKITRRNQDRGIQFDVFL